MRFVETEIVIDEENGTQSLSRAVIDLALIGHFYNYDNNSVAIVGINGIEYVVNMPYKRFKNIFMKYKQPLKLEGN